MKKVLTPTGLVAQWVGPTGTEQWKMLVRDGTLPLDLLLTRITAGPEELRTFVGDGPILTDDQPRVEYFLSLPETDPDIDLSPLKGDARKYVRK